MHMRPIQLGNVFYFLYHSNHFISLFNKPLELNGNGHEYLFQDLRTVSFDVPPQEVVIISFNRFSRCEITRLA